MPWKVHNVRFDGLKPYTHFVDPAVGLNLIVEFDADQGLVTHVFVGPSSSEARLHVRVDYDGVRIERCDHPTHRDCIVVDSVLSTLGLSKDIRRNVSALRGPFPVQVYNGDPHVGAPACFSRNVE